MHVLVLLPWDRPEQHGNLNNNSWCCDFSSSRFPVRISFLSPLVPEDLRKYKRYISDLSISEIVRQLTFMSRNRWKSVFKFKSTSRQSGSACHCSSALVASTVCSPALMAWTIGLVSCPFWINSGSSHLITIRAVLKPMQTLCWYSNRVPGVMWDTGFVGWWKL